MADLRAFDGSLLPTTSTSIKAIQAAPVVAPQARAVSTYHSDTFVRTGSLPAQLLPLVQGQSATFQRKSTEYYDRLLKNGQINPQTVTANEFVNKAGALAKQDWFSGSWFEKALHCLRAQVMFQEVLRSGARDRLEREHADEQLKVVREIGHAQREARTQAIKADELVLSRKG